MMINENLNLHCIYPTCFGSISVSDTCFSCQYCNCCYKESIDRLKKMKDERLTITQLVEESHSIAKSKGFWDKPREIGTLLALIHSEVSEALEADRKGNKKNFAEELADTIIRIADLAGSLNIDLEQAIKNKIEVNKKRIYKHGKKY